MFRYVRFLLPILLILLTQACIVVAPDPGSRPEPTDRPGLSSSKLKTEARHAVMDDVIERWGRNSHPRVNTISLRPHDRDHVEAYGKLTYSGSRGRVHRTYRCIVNRFSGSVRDIRYH